MAFIKQPTTLMDFKYYQKGPKSYAHIGGMKKEGISIGSIGQIPGAKKPEDAKKAAKKFIIDENSDSDSSDGGN